MVACLVHTDPFRDTRISPRPTPGGVLVFVHHSARGLVLRTCVTHIEDARLSPGKPMAEAIAEARVHIASTQDVSHDDAHLVE
jgi:hypothetical protein